MDEISLPQFSDRATDLSTIMPSQQKGLIHRLTETLQRRLFHKRLSALVASTRADVADLSLPLALELALSHLYMHVSKHPPTLLLQIGV